MAHDSPVAPRRKKRIRGGVHQSPGDVTMSFSQDAQPGSVAPDWEVVMEGDVLECHIRGEVCHNLGATTVDRGDVAGLNLVGTSDSAIMEQTKPRYKPRAPKPPTQGDVTTKKSKNSNLNRLIPRRKAPIPQCVLSGEATCSQNIELRNLNLREVTRKYDQDGNKTIISSPEAECAPIPSARAPPPRPSAPPRRGKVKSADKDGLRTTKGAPATMTRDKSHHMESIKEITAPNVESIKQSAKGNAVKTEKPGCTRAGKIHRDVMKQGKVTPPRPPLPEKQKCAGGMPCKQDDFKKKSNKLKQSLDFQQTNLNGIHDTVTFEADEEKDCAGDHPHGNITQMKRKMSEKIVLHRGMSMRCSSVDGDLHDSEPANPSQLGLHVLHHNYQIDADMKTNTDGLLDTTHKCLMGEDVVAEQTNSKPCVRLTDEIQMEETDNIGSISVHDNSNSSKKSDVYERSETRTSKGVKATANCSGLDEYVKVEEAISGCDRLSDTSDIIRVGVECKTEEKCTEMRLTEKYIDLEGSSKLLHHAEVHADPFIENPNVRIDSSKVIKQPIQPVKPFIVVDHKVVKRRSKVTRMENAPVNKDELVPADGNNHDIKLKPHLSGLETCENVLTDTAELLGEEKSPQADEIENQRIDVKCSNKEHILNKNSISVTSDSKVCSSLIKKNNPRTLFTKKENIAGHTQSDNGVQIKQHSPERDTESVTKICDFENDNSEHVELTDIKHIPCELSNANYTEIGDMNQLNDDATCTYTPLHMYSTIKEVRSRTVPKTVSNKYEKNWHKLEKELQSSDLEYVKRSNLLESHLTAEPPGEAKVITVGDNSGFECHLTETKFSPVKSEKITSSFNLTSDIPHPEAFSEITAEDLEVQRVMGISEERITEIRPENICLPPNSNEQSAFHAVAIQNKPSSDVHTSEDVAVSMSCLDKKAFREDIQLERVSCSQPSVATAGGAICGVAVCVTPADVSADSDICGICPNQQHCSPGHLADNTLQGRTYP